MYPEGSIEMYCDHLRKFSDGAFTIAVDANAPVLPVVITPRERKGLWKLLKTQSLYYSYSWRSGISRRLRFTP